MFFVQPCLTGIDEYRLASGDVVEISVIGPPDLAHRAAVDADGRVSLLLLGRLNAAGLTLSQLAVEYPGTPADEGLSPANG